MIFDYKTFSQRKRRAAFAGTWYEGDGKRLAGEIQSYLDNARYDLKDSPLETSFDNNSPVSGDIKALIVPHAGYMFSGQTAAYGYAKAQERQIKRVFLLGPSHYTAFHGAALSEDRTLSTPVGDLPVDFKIIEDLEGKPLMQKRTDVHAKEHALELQLPFIYQAFGRVKIVPIIVGTLSSKTEIRLLGEVINTYVSENDIIIVSSDFTHFGPRYQYEPFEDNIRENIRRLDQQAFQSLRSADLETFLDFQKNTRDTICGLYPLAVLLSMLPHGTRSTLLRYRTSMDTLTQDNNNSVSYMAIAFSGTEDQSPIGLETNLQLEQPTATGLNTDAKRALLEVARAAVETYVQENRTLCPDELYVRRHPIFEVPMGAFCTLFKRANDQSSYPGAKKELRGCIGSIWPTKPLIDTVVDNAIAACSRDYRFQPVAHHELDELAIEINVLTPPKRIACIENIVLGQDGIVMYKNGYQAVFLPSVATEFGWSLEETLMQLSIKAGCGPDGWRTQTSFDTFQTDSFKEDTFFL